MEATEITARRIVGEAPDRAFVGSAWRVHWRRVEATDWSLSLRSSGRYHRGQDLFSTDEIWPVLYTSTAPEVAIWEMVRRSASRNLEYLKNNILTELDVRLDRVLDLTHLTVMERYTAHLTGPDFHLCQEIASLARSRHFQGLLVPSAALEGMNLVITPDNLSDASDLKVVRSSELPIDF